MTRVILEIAPRTYNNIKKHLLRRKPKAEEAGFVYAELVARQNDKVVLSAIKWEAMRPSDFVQRSKYNMELTDAARGRVIKTAHDLNASIVEFHCHLSQQDASFSWSDISGLSEFVPHVWWRLKGRPYAAVVMSQTGYDALVWLENPDTPQQCELRVDNERLRPSGATLTWRKNTEETSGLKSI